MCFVREESFKYIYQRDKILVDIFLRPEFFYQLFTIHSVANRHNMPLINVLLTSKIKQSYKAASVSLTRSPIYLVLSLISTKAAKVGLLWPNISIV